MRYIWLADKSEWMLVSQALGKSIRRWCRHSCLRQTGSGNELQANREAQTALEELPVPDGRPVPSSAQQQLLLIIVVLAAVCRFG